MNVVPKRIGFRRGDPEERLTTREWLVTNGLGGYASGTLAGVFTRRFHGPLVAALSAPAGRTLFVGHLGERATLPNGETFAMTGSHTEERGLVLPDLEFLEEVRLEMGLPVWRFAKGGVVVERRVVVPHTRNTAYVIYRVLAGAGPVTFTLEPGLSVRPHEGALKTDRAPSWPVTAEACGMRVAAGPFPDLRLIIAGAEPRVTLVEKPSPTFIYAIEQARGYDFQGQVFLPGEIAFEVSPGGEASLVVTVEQGAKAPAGSGAHALNDEEERRAQLVAEAHTAARSGISAELVLAADQFVIQPALIEPLPGGAGPAQAQSERTRTIIAGYPWFTDWGRDTMISLEGLTLVTGRHDEAREILHMFARHVKDGLIPNMFPEGKNEGLYHTADATLWFFHAVKRYVDTTGDRDTLRTLLPTFVDILERHLAGTRFGIRVDPSDGLLTQGAEGYQLTWMDAKVDGWVVTPRRGKAVEINALFYNALRILAEWLRDERGRDQGAAVEALADRHQASFNKRFWYQAGGHLYDVVDGEKGDDEANRPNQILAVGLPHPVLDASRWGSVLTVVERTLLTPVGLRSLAPGHPDYTRRYDGDLRARDAAYHQGTVWGWLFGPFLDAWMRVNPGQHAKVRGFVEAMGSTLSEACLGTISEIYDAEAPYTPRGCHAQAWSVAETLRALVLTSG